MRSFLTLIVAVAVAVSGLTVAGLVAPVLESPALAQKAKPAKKPRATRNPPSHMTGFEHQQCSVQNPCSTRNTW
jgi:hypothetical protein